MAEADKGAETEAEKAGKTKPAGGSSGNMKLVIAGAVALFVAVLGAQVAAPLLNRMLEGGSHEQSAEVTDEQAEGADANLVLAEAAPEPEKQEPLAPANYVSLDPPFVVSFDEEDGTRYLQLQAQAMTRDAHTVEDIKKHAPALRNAFLFLLSSYDLEELTTLKGKEKLRADLLAKANEVLAKNGSEGAIEELYFTNLVIQ
jgi:flagellar protein FliL